MATSTLTDLTGSSGYVRVQWDDSEEPTDFYAWRLYHRRTDEGRWTLIYETLESEASYDHHSYAWANLVEQEIVLVAVTRNPTTGEITESAYTGANSFTPTGDTKYTFVHPTDPTKSVVLHLTTGAQYEDDDEQEVIKLLGADGADGKKKINRGQFYGISGSLDCQIMPGYAEQRFKLQALRREGVPVFLRTPFGDLWKVAIGKLSFDLMSGMGQDEASTITIPFEEVG